MSISFRLPPSVDGTFWGQPIAGFWELFRQVTAEGDTTRLVDADADRTWFYAIEPVR